MSYEIIAHVENPSTARVLVVALRAHGFHPMEFGEGGLPGVPNLFGAQGRSGAGARGRGRRCNRSGA